MTAMTAREAKQQYCPMGSDIQAYSLKVASSFIHAQIQGRRIKKKSDKNKTHRIGQLDALRAKERGAEIHLVVRHPLDRLVSNWVFWTKFANSGLTTIAQNDLKLHDRLTKAATLEDWYEASEETYNPHWYPQADYHSRDGELVPTHLWPLESLPKDQPDQITNASPRRKPSWEDYYTDSFRAQMEDRYAADLELYELSKENWDGRTTPSLLFGS